MSQHNSTVTLHVVASVDGYIARPDNTVSWMDSPGDVYEKGLSESEAAASMTPIDCFVLGSRTYEHALELGWPYGETPTVVLTSRELPCSRKSVQFYSGDPVKLVREALAPKYRNIWLVGGAATGQAFLQLDLVDEIRLTIAPVLLGQGLRLFSDSAAETKWRLKDMAAYKNGFVELAYGRPTQASSLGDGVQNDL